jgi:hypothetical protein
LRDVEEGRPVLFAERVGGNTVSFERFGRRHVAAHDFAAIRVLEKCGFTASGEAGDDSEAHWDDVEELVLRLEE